MKRPLVMATLADNRATPPFVASMVKAGMGGVRFNSAHASPAQIVELTRMVRSVSPGQVILVDTKGAEVRTTPLAGRADEVMIPDGARLSIVSGGSEPSTPSRLCVTASGVCAQAREGMAVAVDDGEIILAVESVGADEVMCRVTKGGVLGSRKTVNFRGIELEALPALTEADRAAILASVEAGVDIIAHSFVRSAADVEAVRECCGPAGPAVYAKIECPAGVRNLDSILEAADGLLCARGDLGATMGLENVAAIEMDCIEACRRAYKPLIIATQLLHTMMESPAPSRAEVVDIAFATREGVGALLLTGETARGHYPLECVEWMTRIINASVRK